MEQKRPQPKRDYDTKCKAPKDCRDLKDVINGVCETHRNTRKLVKAYTNDFIMMRDSGQ